MSRSYNPQELMKLALEAREKSYSPYSGYAVGAALLTGSGKIFSGCNIENAAYPATVCAERTAFFKALSDGERSFVAIAVAGGKEGADSCAPCGVCRQVMREFCDPENFNVIFMLDGRIETLRLSALLPYSFGPDNLK